MSSKADRLAPYWPQPGRSILENLLVDVPFPYELQTGSMDNKSPWDKESATRIHHKLADKGIPDLAWTGGKAPEETFRMEVSSMQTARQ